MSSFGTNASASIVSVSSLESGSKVKIGEILSFPSLGVYVIVAGLRWGGNATGKRSLAVFVNDANAPAYDLSAYRTSDTKFPTKTTEFYHRFTLLVNITNANSTIHAYAQQDSGSSLSVAMISLGAMKIG